MKSIIVIGLLFGDECKGSVVNSLVRKHNSKLVVRFNGGFQAAHNVHTETKLKSENERLASELRSLRRMLATHSKKRPEPTTPLYDDQMAAAEMLAVLEAAQVEVLFELSKAGFVNVDSLLEKLGIQSAFQFVSYLANCRAALVHGNRLLLTDFGRDLLRWIESVPSTEQRDL